MMACVDHQLSGSNATSNTENGHENMCFILVDPILDEEGILHNIAEPLDTNLDNQSQILDCHIRYNCSTCSKSFNSVVKLDKHISMNCKSKRASNRSNSTTCPYCGKLFKIPSTLATHTCIDNQVVGYKCHICLKAFNKLSLYRNHMMQHPSDPLKFLCYKCDQMFTNFQTFAHHSHNVDGDKYICDVCGLSFSNVSKFKHHKVMHSEDRPFVCHLCNMTFKVKSAWKLHRLRHEQKERDKKCYICGRSFKDAVVFKQHMETHLSEKKFACETCGKKFLRHYNLLVHCRIHTGYKPYTCKSCSRTFTQLAGLKSHEKSHHNKLMYIPVKSISLL